MIAASSEQYALGAKDRWATSSCPDSLDVYATHCACGEIRPAVTIVLTLLLAFVGWFVPRLPCHCSTFDERARIQPVTVPSTIPAAAAGDQFSAGFPQRPQAMNFASGLQSEYCKRGEKATRNGCVVIGTTGDWQRIFAFEK